MKTYQTWIHGEMVQTDGTPPLALAWTCPNCGHQPPIALSGNRFVKRRCACEREQRSKAAIQKDTGREGDRLIPKKSQRTAMTPLSQMLRSDVSTMPPAELFWTCPICGPIEPFALPSGRWMRRSCNCQRRVREEQERMLARETWNREQLQRTFGGWLGSHWVDTEIVRVMGQKTFGTYSIVRQPEAFEQAYAFAQRPTGNLLFWGGYGTGKTHLEAAICNYRREKGATTDGTDLRAWTSIFVSAPHLFAAYHETKREYDQTVHIRLMASLTTSPLLVIDDVDKRTPQKGDWDVYWMIFDTRSTANRPTVLSTNKCEDLASYIGESSFSRLRRDFISVPMVGDDCRQEETQL